MQVVKVLYPKENVLTVKLYSCLGLSCEYRAYEDIRQRTLM